MRSETFPALLPVREPLLLIRAYRTLFRFTPSAAAFFSLPFILAVSDGRLILGHIGPLLR